MLAISSTNRRQNLQNLFSGKDVAIASRLAVRDTAKKIRTEISKEVRTVYKVRAGDIRSESRVKTSNTAAKSEIQYTGFRPHLGKFARGQTGNITARVRNPRPVRGGFRINRINPNLIFRRLTNVELANPKYANRKSGIRVLRTISISEMVSRVNYNQRIINIVGDQYESRFNHHFARRIALR